MNSPSNPGDALPELADDHVDEHEDRGAILVMVLVMMVIGAFVVLPIMVYTTSVFRAGRVQTDKAEAIELARGGTWVALSNQEDLYDLCTGGTLPASLEGVTTTCSVVETETLRPAAEIPFHVATVQSDIQVPPDIVAGLGDPSAAYVNPNSTVTNPDDYDVWLDIPDWSSDSSANKVWLPDLPVQATSSGGTRDTVMLPGTQDPLYASCRVFFPGTFTNPITIAEPAYFASGVYYFTEPITIANGADVVVGSGAEGGCTTDFEAIAFAQTVPDPLNMSGIGGTFVLGDDASVVVDDSGVGDIRFAMNQRYVSEDETSVLASSNVSIVSVNGTHEPLVGGEALGDDLIVPGVIGIPASRVGTDGSPLAALSDYTPSNLTAKAYAPDPPTNVSSDDYHRPSLPPGPGRLTVRWDAPNDNGSPITGYVATDLHSGLSCSPPTPTLPDTSVQTSCTITEISHPWMQYPTVVVTATNALGTSDPSTPTDGPRVDILGGYPHSWSPAMNEPDAPQNATLSDVYSDGFGVSWDPPADDGGGPVVGYRVTAYNGVDPDVTCEAWWDETSCVLRSSDGLIDGNAYAIDVVALQQEGPTPDEYESAPATIAMLPLIVNPAADPAPVQTPAPSSSIRIPDPILGLTTSTAANTEVSIAGYISVPQGRVEIGAAVPASTDVSLIGGLVAGDIWLDPAGSPGTLEIYLDNPVAQKRVRIQSTTSGNYAAQSDAIVQVNRSGSIAINSWVVQ